MSRPAGPGEPVAYDIFGAARRTVQAMTREKRLLAARGFARSSWKDRRLTESEIAQVDRRVGLDLMGAPPYYFSSSVHSAALVGFPGVP